MKLGMAIAANRPIMATTIIISSSVKPLLRDVLVFIFCFVCYGVNTATSGLLLLRLVFTYCLLLTVSMKIPDQGLKSMETSVFPIQFDPTDASVVMRSQE